jgi:hypothetical protein
VAVILSFITQKHDFSVVMVNGRFITQKHDLRIKLKFYNMGFKGLCYKPEIYSQMSVCHGQMSLKRTFDREGTK